MGQVYCGKENQDSVINFCLLFPFLLPFSVRPTKFKLDTHGQWVDLLCASNTSSQYILVAWFFFFFVSVHLANVKNLQLQNYFNMPLMAMTGGMWALLTSLLYFLYIMKWRWLEVFEHLWALALVENAFAATFLFWKIRILCYRICYQFLFTWNKMELPTAETGHI